MERHQTVSIRYIGYTLIVAAALIFAGCMTSNNQQIFDPNTGKHPADWVSTHGATFLTDPALCIECHGTDLQGGISGVSCYSATWNGISCHANGPGGHPAGWNIPSSHGSHAKSAPGAAAMQGFSTCQICHGSDFTGGLVNTACSSCHGVNAPHPPKPWISSALTHTSTDTGNAPVCALCHTNGANSPIVPPSPPAGASPGCFNATLCHGAAGHPSGWAVPTMHGAFAKAAPNPATMSGFSTCQPCHGNTFGGNATHPACFSCHGGSAPHPTSWRTGTYTHTNTNTSNASVCALCHTNGVNSPIAPPSPAAPAGTPPGCFNSTLCHGQVGHPVGWSAPTVHGVRAKAAPNTATMSGFSTCQACHGNNFAGGTVNRACASCHGGTAPHPTSWLPNDTYSHDNTNQANAPVCGLCHLNDRTPPSYAPLPPGTQVGCMNNTLCHGNQ